MGTLYKGAAAEVPAGAVEPTLAVPGWFLPALLPHRTHRVGDVGEWSAAAHMGECPEGARWMGYLPPGAAVDDEGTVRYALRSRGNVLAAVVCSWEGGEAAAVFRWRVR